MSTADQCADLQLDALSAAGCVRVFVEKASGAARDRSALKAALRAAKPGDTLVVWKLDRLARSIRQLIDTIERLEHRGVGFKSLRARAMNGYHVMRQPVGYRYDRVAGRLTGCFSKGRTRHYGYYLCVNKGCAERGKSVRHEVVEREFEELLRSMTPSADPMALARAMFTDLWQGRIDAARSKANAIEAELRKADKTIAQYLDRIVETKVISLIEVYEERIRALEENKARIRESLRDETKPRGSFEDIYRTALAFLASPSKLWASEQIEDKRAVLKAAFAEPLTYVRGEGFRTAVTSAPFRLLSALETGICRMVDADPAILNQLFETLEDWNACLSSLPDLPIAEEAPPPAPARRKPPAPSI